MDTKKKTIMVILDGLDYTYIEKNLDKFHFFKKLYDNKKLCPLESVVPADSIPSWTTIYTGPQIINPLTFQAGYAINGLKMNTFFPSSLNTSQNECP